MSKYYFILKATQPTALRADTAKEQPYTAVTSGSMSIGSANYPWTFYPAVKGQPYGSIQFTGAPTPPNDTYYTDDFATASTTNTAAPEAPGAGSSASGGGSGTSGGSSGGSPTGQYADLQQFLADHLDLYFNPTLARSKKDQNQTATAIKSGGWGENSDAGLAMFIAAINKRKDASAVNAFAGKDLLVDLDANKLTKDSSPAALQFAWVATHPVDQSGYDAAKEIGFNTKIPEGLFAAKDTPLRRLHEMLALSPAPFVIIDGPIPEGAKLEISDKKNTNTVDFLAAYPGGVILGIGINRGDTTTAAFSNDLALNTAIYGPLAKSAIGGTQLTMKLTAGGKTYTSSNVKMGATVNFSLPGSSAAAAAPAPAEPAADAKSLSGEANLQMNTSLGLTVGGTRPGFKLQNVYKTTGGGAAMNSPQVVLQKRTVGSGDVFELSVNTAEDAVILIPIVEKQSINEAVEHWSETILSALPAATATAKSGTPHVALKQITWGYEEHYRRFGLPDVGNIRLIAYEPSTSRNIPEDVNVISIEAAIRDGYTGNSKWDPIEYAIAMYIANDSNVVGTRLYTSAALNREMNSFPDTRYQTN